MTKKKSKRPAGYYMRYAGMVGQLFVLLLIMTYLGGFLDQKFDTNLFTPFLLIFGLLVYLYKIYIDLTQEEV